MLEVAIADVAVDEDARPEAPVAVRAAPVGEDDGKRDLALAEIIPDMLAELGRGAAEIECVVDELESEAEIGAIGAEGRPLVAPAPGDGRADFGGGGEQRRGLGGDDGEVLVFRGRGVLRRGELHHLALGDDRGGVGKNVEGVDRADLDHHLERLAEQEIADEHARLVAPDHARGELAAAKLALVDDVVMKQCRGVHEFDARGELDVGAAAIAEHRRCGDRQHRPEPLAAGIDEMARDLGDHADLGPGAVEDQFVDALHRVPRCLDQWRDARRAPAFAFVQRYDNTHVGQLLPVASQPQYGCPFAPTREGAAADRGRREVNSIPTSVRMNTSCRCRAARRLRQ